jgi:hypothetical protein
MNKIFSMVLQHERQCGLSISVSEDSKALINATDSKSNGSRSGKNLMPPSGTKRYCTFCHKSNHVVENCFKKHGLPPHLQRGNTSGSAHHAASEGGDYDDDSASAASHETRSQGPVITQDQFDKLMSLLQTSSINQGASSATSNQVSSSKAAGPSSASPQGTSYTFSTYSLFCHNVNLGSWIIDSGASHHICASLHWFHSYSEITPMTIKLPNGHHVTTKFAGTVIFNPDFKLHNVLFVPEFSVNLLSVSGLCHDTQYLVSFTHNTCKIQEQMSLRMIGSAERQDGLYYLVLTNKETLKPTSQESSNVNAVSVCKVNKE